MRAGAPWVHPIYREALLGAGNRLRRAAARPAEALFQLVAWAVLAAGVIFVWRRLDGDRIGLGIAGALQTPWLAAPVLVLVAAWIVHRFVATNAHALHTGWWAAAPVPLRAARLWLALVALAAGLAGLGATAGALYAIAAIAQRPTPWLEPALWLVLPAVLIGSVVGATAAVVAGGRDDQTAGAGYARYGLPLFELPRPRQLPELARWQRIETLRAFRAGGRRWPFMLLGLALPAALPLPSLTGLLLLAGTLVWFGTVLRAAHDVIDAAHRLLAAQPVPARIFAAAVVHYPAQATLVALGLGAIALLLQQAPAVFVLGWALALPAWVALDLAVVLAHRADRRRAGVVLAALAVALVACAQSFWPATPLLWLAALVHYVRRIGRP